ncbi:hypothetical protein FUT69_09515 [Xylella taiwanensis]|uniref:Uncharacterized protein n=2 Tax=Xylella taiwanensis TaxID=1444770 RepID=A0ABS8TWX9_9GAMM|nr:hypothetical protein [Xylella taiwanensis]MCD8456061.1 hypothetical protein [Xylella taiwanensis]MCD8458465.1 hypothetical protein [Xylella taiwanensis]MCD8460601.1 hypothetical protein [Xylella taiwanensis]MCD8463337.1 hypothetical protein [Xylella taiwanensis]MCD8465106.1 hypothetical protein [Xylella taiwanensis]
MRELSVQEVKNVDGGFLFFVSSGISSPEIISPVSPVAFSPYPSSGGFPFKSDGSSASLLGYNLGKLVVQEFFVRRVNVYNITQVINK